MTSEVPPPQISPRVSRHALALLIAGARRRGTSNPESSGNKEPQESRIGQREEERGERRERREERGDRREERGGMLPTT